MRYIGFLFLLILTLTSCEQVLKTGMKKSMKEVVKETAEITSEKTLKAEAKVVTKGALKLTVDVFASWTSCPSCCKKG